MNSAARYFALATVLAAGVLLFAPVNAGASGASCELRAVTQPFLPWLDSKYYFLMPGGDLESSAGWTFAGGARLLEGNEPFYVHRADDRRSLFLPSGGSARTASICVDSDEPTMRFFVRNTGSPLSVLAVEARVRTTLLGVTATTSLPLGAVLGTQEWHPSLPVLFKLSLNQMLGGTTTVDFRFTALGLGGKWQVDDVYVDPFKDR
ncbi:hypothetical protein BH20ACT13_BH20ACT13_08240 [soil metagenome]